MLTSRIELHQGVPTVMVDDRPILPMMGLGAPGFAEADGLIGAGVQLYYPLAPNNAHQRWDGRGGIDYSHDERLLDEFLTRHPDALVLPEVGYLNRVPRAWMDDHPEELTWLNTQRYGLGPSPASEVFTCESEELISAFVDHFEQSPWSDNIIGYLVNNGKSHEWLAWDWFRPDIIGLDDYSRPMVRRFRTYLVERYGGDVEALRESWHDASVTFDTAEPPTVPVRMGKPWQVLLPEQDAARVYDYNRCYAEAWADQAIRFASAVKRALPGPKLAALYHGYSKLHCHDTYIQVVGQLGFSRLLRHDNIDLVLAPYSYENRGLDGVHYIQLCEGSVKLHGKAVMDQIDTRTFRTSPPQPQWGQVETLPGTLEVMKRDVAACATQGMLAQVYDMCRTDRAWGLMENTRFWYDTPEQHDLMEKLASVIRRGMDRQRTSAAETAVLIDNDSFMRQALNRGFGSLYVTAQLQYQFGRVPAPYDCYLLDDLPEMPPYKLYVLLNAFGLDGAVGQSLVQRVTEQGATVLYFYAPGCYHEGKLDVPGIAERAGVGLGMDDRKAFIQTRLVDRSHPLLADCDGIESYGSDIDPAHFRRTTAYFPDRKDTFLFSPVFYADDPDAQVLGTLADNGKPALVDKAWGRGRIVYSSAPMMPGELLCNIARRAGVHLYTDGDDLVYAGGSLVSVTSRQQGRRTIGLPGPTTVCDALTGECLGRNVERVELDMSLHETRILELVD